MLARGIGILAIVLVGCANPASQKETEHTIVLGAGGAVEIELPKGKAQGGSYIFVEYEAIEDWLELELGLSMFPQSGGVELSGDLLFKKPFQLTNRLECMVGAGPEVVREVHSPDNGTFIGGETAADFMYWPSEHLGLWAEPSYDFVFRDGVAHGIGATGGITFGW